MEIQYLLMCFDTVLFILAPELFLFDFSGGLANLGASRIYPRSIHDHDCLESSLCYNPDSKIGL